MITMVTQQQMTASQSAEFLDRVRKAVNGVFTELQIGRAPG